MANFNVENAMDQMGQLPPGAAAAPPAGGGAGSEYNILSMYPWILARGYAGLTAPTFRGYGFGFRGRKAAKWFSRRGLNRIVGRPPAQSWYNFGRWPQWARPSATMAATERNVLSRLTRGPAFLPQSFQQMWLPKVNVEGLGRGAGKLAQKKANLASRGFVFAGVAESTLAQINLTAMATGNTSFMYSRKAMQAMTQRFMGAAKARGMTDVVKALSNVPMSGTSLKKMAEALAGGAEGMLPDWAAKFATKVGSTRLGASAGRLLHYGLPLVSYYFTAKLVADIAEWGTKKILRGLNWYYFKMPLTVYRYGTQGLRRPILGSGTFIDSPGAQTQRQRAVQAIQNSRLNARSALGGEAALMHEYFG